MCAPRRVLSGRSPMTREKEVTEIMCGSWRSRSGSPIILARIIIGRSCGAASRHWSCLPSTSRMIFLLMETVYWCLPATQHLQLGSLLKLGFHGKIPCLAVRT